jgi:hypothetical protein
MVEPVEYLVVCDCDGTVRPVALIHDRRPSGGPLSLRGIGEGDTAALFAVADGEQHAKLYRRAAESWAERSVTETVWGDGHSTWTIRCAACGQQVQLSGDKLATVASKLADARDQLRINSARQHELPLGVLTRILSR